jgi:alkylation response protein AidB-like acyl-CoA dehydrogenase
LLPQRSHRGQQFHPRFDDCRVPKSQVLGELHRGFAVANQCLGATRLQVAATCLGRAERALDLAIRWAADRQQFGQAIGKFQGVSFKLADMATELKAAELLTLEAAWKVDQVRQPTPTRRWPLKATEVLAMVADEALQIHGGMGLMADLPSSASGAMSGRADSGTRDPAAHHSRALLRPFGA